jgi:hypothetical protein
MKKVALFGDSFGFKKKDEVFPSWVSLLTQHFLVDNFSQCGVSEYKILKQIQSVNLEDYNFVLITHTSHSRIFVDYNPVHAVSEYHQNCDIIYTDIESRSDEFSQACKLYFKHIFNNEFAKNIHNLILKEISQIVSTKKVIHMTHFDHNDLYLLPGLLEFHGLFLKNQGPVNHYNMQANKTIYEAVLQKLV